MAAIENDILSEFYRRLDEIENITPSMLDALRTVLSSSAKLKPEELVRIFAPPSEEEIP